MKVSKYAIFIYSSTHLTISPQSILLIKRFSKRIFSVLPPDESFDTAQPVTRLKRTVSCLKASSLKIS